MYFGDELSGLDNQRLQLTYGSVSHQFFGMLNTANKIPTWNTFPTTIELTISGLIFPASRAARDATSCRSVAVKLVNFPPNVPKGVLFAATMYTSLTAKSITSRLQNIGVKVFD